MPGAPTEKLVKEGLLGGLPLPLPHADVRMGSVLPAVLGINGKYVRTLRNW